MNIVVLDGYHLNPGDLKWDRLEALGNVKIYDRTTPENIITRSLNADILLSNKVIIDEFIISQLPKLKGIFVMATGYNNIDVIAAQKKGIPVCNVSNYSTDSVAQHVFSCLLAILNRVENYALECRNGVWNELNDWSYTNEPIINLSGRKMGIIGFGKIGQKVAEIALAFGMHVLVSHRYPIIDKRLNIEFVTLPEVFQQADFLSLHVPLNDSTFEIINKNSLGFMKQSSILINTGRGALINENDLALALLSGTIRAAALDVMVQEPPLLDNPLLNLKNCYITPHMAWTGDKSREKMMDILVNNIKGFLSGNIQNKVN